MNAKAVGARAQAQRQRILDAARRCFAERGFHAASMASIAETAGMSPGLIYRYFTGKGDIIQGIVREQLALMDADMQTRRVQLADLAGLLADQYRQCSGTPDRPGLDPVLLLEIYAEANRDPLIAEAMAEMDQTLQTRIEQWLALPFERGGAAVPADEVAARSLALRMLIDGLKMRQAGDPGLDRDLLLQALQLVLPAVVGRAGK